MYEKKGRPLREGSDEVGFHFWIRSWYPKTDWQRGRFPEKDYARTEFVDEIVLVSTCLRTYRYMSYRSSRQWDRRPIRNRRYDRRYSIFACIHRLTDWYWIFSTSIDLRSTLDLISWKWSTTSWKNPSESTRERRSFKRSSKSVSITSETWKCLR